MEWTASGWVSEVKIVGGRNKRTMKCERYACNPERVEKGGRRLKIPFPNEGTGSGHNATGMSDCEDKPHTRDDRVLFRAADG